MSELRGNLRKEFHDRDYRHVYADESLNTHIATQIKVLREQRGMTQQQLAKATGMAQPRIAVLEDINYPSWSINTLRRLANAFDLRLTVRFETFSSLIPEIEGFSAESLERVSFEDDAWFHHADAQPAESAISRMLAPPMRQQPDVRMGFGPARVYSPSPADWQTYSNRTRPGSVNAAVIGK